MRTENRDPSLPKAAGRVHEGIHSRRGEAPPANRLSLGQLFHPGAVDSAQRSRILLAGAIAALVAAVPSVVGWCVPNPGGEEPVTAARSGAADAGPAGPRHPVAAAAPPARPQPSGASLPTRPEREIPLDLGEAPAPTGRRSSTRLFTWLLGVALKLGVVLATAYACLAVLRRFVPGASTTVPGAEMGVRHTITLGPGRSIHLLEVEGHRILVGATPHQVSLLADLTDLGSPQEESRGASSEAPGASESFEGRLGALMIERRVERGAETAEASSTAAPGSPVPGPETYTDAELREEVRRRLFTLNRSAAGLQKLGEWAQKGDRGTCPGR